jgi:glycosyltransferase involved in cell wall biosynthesis
MKSERPLVTIIVPSYNQGKFLAATLDSILSQDYRPIEVWVVDGGSKDETVAVLETYGRRHPELHWLSEPDKGPADAVNKGLARAKGEICGIQSSDDVYLPGAVSEAVAALADHPEAAIVYAEGYPIDEQGMQLSPPWHWKPYSYERFLCGSTFILQSSAFFRTEAGRRVGGWRADYFVADVDFWLRILHHRSAVKLDRVWSAYRRHDTQRNTQTREIFESYWRMIAESPELQIAPLRHRRAADAGRRMFAQHYNPAGSRLWRSYQLWRALLSYPPSWFALRNPGLLVPGLATFVNAVRAERRPK